MSNVAFIGCGAIAVEHLRALESVEGLTPVAYCDRNLSQAEHLMHTYGGAVATDDVDLILNDDDIHAVYICTYHDTHADLAVRASQAGKHIMIEKPMALSVEDCLRIGDAVERYQVTLMTAFKLRYYPMVVRAKEYIPEPKLVLAQLTDSRWPDDFWAQQPVIGGGNVASQGVHVFDLITYFNGSEPKSVTAHGGTVSHPSPDIVDLALATIEFQNGMFASVVVGDCGLSPYMSKFSFQLFDGVRTVCIHNRLMNGEFSDGETVQSIRDEQELGMIEENKAFSTALRDNTVPPTTWKDGFRAASLTHAIFNAIRTGQKQVIPSL